MTWGGFLILAAAVVGTLYEQKEKKIQELKQAYIGVIEILAKYLDASDRYTKGHSVRVADYATEIAIAMELPRSEVENIRVAGLLHDIGKIEVSSDLIRKAASLTHDEKKLVDEHTEKGAVLLGSVGAVLKEAIPIVLSHHRYFIAGQEAEGERPKHIPLGARIIAVADAFDAMVSDRPYRQGKPAWQAIEELQRWSGTQFDPLVVEAFKKVVGEKVEVV
jgi:putative nucleotidyltransferase with HDIG domain